MEEISIKEIPIPLTLEEIISQGGIEGSDEAYDREDGFGYSGENCAFLYYGGDEFSGGKPFTGLYYELYENGKLESYVMYEDGMPIGGYYSFYQNGKIASYNFFTKNKKNDFCYYYNDKGDLERADIWQNGKFIRKTF